LSAFESSTFARAAASQRFDATKVALRSRTDGAIIRQRTNFRLRQAYFAEDLACVLTEQGRVAGAANN
jgi:hypothetical protein